MRRGLHLLAWAPLACGCFPTSTPFNEPLLPVRAQEAPEAIPVPEENDPTPYARHALTEKIVEYARGYCRKRSGDSVASDYAPDALLRTAGEPDRRGPSALAAAWEARADLLGDAKCPGPQVFIKGSTAVILSAEAGTNAGTSLGIKGQTGQTKVVGVMSAKVDVFTPDGKIIEEHQYADAPTLLAQLGLYDRERRRVSVPNWVFECHIATGESGERANVSLARRMQRAFERRDEAAYAAALDDDIVWDDYMALAPTRGKADVVKRFDAQAGAFSRAQLDCETRGIVDYVVSECTLNAAQTGALLVAGMKVPPTQGDVIVHTLDILQVREGKVLRGWTYGNSAEVAKELGVWVPIAPPAPEPPDSGT